MNKADVVASALFVQQGSTKFFMGAFNMVSSKSRCFIQPRIQSRTVPQAVRCRLPLASGPLEMSYVPDPRY